MEDAHGPRGHDAAGLFYYVEGVLRPVFDERLEVLDVSGVRFRGVIYVGFVDGIGAIFGE